MKRVSVLAVLALVTMLWLPSSATAGPVVQWDQVNDGPITHFIVGTNSLAQGFTPTLDALDTVQLCVGGDAAELGVTIRSGSADGPVLGTSSIEATPPNPQPWPVPAVPVLLTFEFSSPVELTPGDSYFIRGFNVTGSSYAHRIADPGDPAFGHVGLWYREGLSADVTAVDPASGASYVPAVTCPTPG